METRRPLIAEIKRNSLDDGPGIRSVVFFKGCPLSCVWCHNPECMDSRPELMLRPERCIGCGACEEICPEGAVPRGGPCTIERGLCTLCGACADECPTCARSIVGRYITPDELVEILAQDKTFYDNSGGGVTLSGGEPTVYLDYTAEVSKKLRARGIKICLETSGDVDWERFAGRLLPSLSIVFVDMKLLDRTLHKRFTGRDNTRILENIERLVALGSPGTLVRVPLIPDVVATGENLSAIARWLWQRGIHRIALLPYNPLWISKARGLGKRLTYERDTWMTQEEREKVREIFKDFEIAREI